MNNIISKEEKDHIDKVCKYYCISNYSFNPDGSINVDGDVSIRNSELKILPIKFGRVSGGFSCSNNTLRSLVGAPHTVGGNFTCSFNYLTSLIGGPSVVGGIYTCGYNQLISLNGLAESIGGIFTCNGTRALISTYSGDVDVEIAGYCEIVQSGIPEIIDEHRQYLNIILKYQRHFLIWNDDLSLNEINFQELLDEIKDGLL